MDASMNRIESLMLEIIDFLKSRTRLPPPATSLAAAAATTPPQTLPPISATETPPSLASSAAPSPTSAIKPPTSAPSSSIITLPPKQAPVTNPVAPKSAPKPTPKSTPATKPPPLMLHTNRSSWVNREEPTYGVHAKHEWRPPWRLRERAPRAIVRVEWRPPWFTKSYPDFRLEDKASSSGVECYVPYFTFPCACAWLGVEWQWVVVHCGFSLSCTA